MTSLRVMVIEDNPILAASVAGMLSASGHQPEVFGDGQSAIAAYGDNDYHLILVDLVMPDLDGLEITRTLRKLQKKKGWRPILMVSSFSNVEEQVRALDGGCDDFLSKPVDSAMLAAKIASFRRIHELQLQLESQNEHFRQLQGEREEEGRVAQQLMRRLVMRAEMDKKVLQHFVRATQQLSGDLILATTSSTGDRYVMLADATGHGLPAALTQIPLSQTFYAMAARGFSPVSIALEMNKHHRQYAPVYRSVAAVIAVHRNHDQTLEVWNGGMPEALLMDLHGQVVRRFRSRNLPLGVDSSAALYSDSEVVGLDSTYHVVLCSDGVLEAEDADGDWFGAGRFEMALADGAVSGNFVGSVEQALDQHLDGAHAHDDLSCVVMCCESSVVTVPLEVSEQSGGELPVADYWRLALTLSIAQLRHLDVVPSLTSWLRQLGVSERDSSRLSLTLGELVNNAVDHGLLQLESSLKNQPDGFERYAEERQQRLETISHGSIDLEVAQASRNQPITLWVHDSGKGFDWQEQANPSSTVTTAYHGRGLSLVRAMSERLDIRGEGNEIYVELSTNGIRAAGAGAVDSGEKS